MHARHEIDLDLSIPGATTAMKIAEAVAIESGWRIRVGPVQALDNMPARHSLILTSSGMRPTKAAILEARTLARGAMAYAKF